MKRSHLNVMLVVLAVASAGVISNQVEAAGANLDCNLRFSLSSWSAIYKHSEGSGVVTCENGTSIPVTIEAKGVGLTAGKSEIDGGTGHFSDVHTIEDVLGRYIQGEAHAGMVKSGSAQVLTKGTVSLALAGTGEGIDLGIDVGELTLSRTK